jgi:hypothetical protein
MTEPDDRLAQFFAVEVPPVRDPVFLAQVQERVARQVFIGDLKSLAAVSTGGTVVLWLVWPTVHDTLSLLGRGLAPGVIAACVALSILAMTSGRALDFRS